MLTWVAIIASLGVAALAAIGGIVSFAIALFRLFSQPFTPGAGKKFDHTLAASN